MGLTFTQISHHDLNSDFREFEYFRYGNAHQAQALIKALGTAGKVIDVDAVLNPKQSQILAGNIDCLARKQTDKQFQQFLFETAEFLRKSERSGYFVWCN